MKILQSQIGAVGLALLSCVTLAPLAPGAPPHQANNIVFVDNVNGDDANPGTRTEPKATIQAGEDAAEALYGQDGIVVVWGGGPAYEESVTVSSSMKLCGNGNGIHGLERQGPRPIVTGEFYATDIGSVAINGFEIFATNFAAIMLQNVGEASCSYNFLHERNGILIVTWGSATSTVHLENNRIDSLPMYGNGVRVQSDETSHLTLHATGNTFGESDGASVAFGITSNDFSEMTVTVDGNHVDGGASGIWAISEEESRLKVKADNNEFLGSEYGGAGVLFESFHDSHHTVEVTGNVTEFPGGINAHSYGKSTLNLLAKKNTAVGDILGGIGVIAFEDSTMNTLVEDNRVGVIFGGAGQNSVLNFTVEGNDIDGKGEYSNLGSGVQGFDNGVIHAAFTNNRIRGVNGDGIYLEDFGTATITVTALDQNHITGSAGNGIFVDLGNPASSVNGTKNNAVTNSQGNSLEVVNEPVNHQIILNGATIAPLVDTP